MIPLRKLYFAGRCKENLYVLDMDADLFIGLSDPKDGELPSGSCSVSVNGIKRCFYDTCCFYNTCSRVGRLFHGRRVNLPQHEIEIQFIFNRGVYSIFGD